MEKLKLNVTLENGTNEKGESFEYFTYAVQVGERFYSVLPNFADKKLLRVLIQEAYEKDKKAEFFVVPVKKESVWNYKAKDGIIYPITSDYSYYVDIGGMKIYLRPQNGEDVRILSYLVSK